MDNATIVAIIILVGIFTLMAITVYRHGVDAGIKLWSVMGALTGVALGAITSYYFTNKSNHYEIQQAQLQKEAAILALNNASLKAAEADKFLATFALNLKGEKNSPGGTTVKILRLIPDSERAELVESAEHASTQLKEIHALTYAVMPGKKP